MAETKYQIKLQDLATAEMKKVQAAMKAIEESTGDAREEFKKLDDSTKYLKKIQAQIDETKKSTDGAAKSASVFSELWDEFDPTGLIKADLVASAIKESFSAIVDFAQESVGEFLDAQEGFAKLSALVKATGGSVGYTTDELSDMADQMQENLAIDADLVRGAEGILVSFQNISGEAFPRTLAAAADLSQVFGSLDSASTALGKALSNPSEGLAALSRAGVTFTDSEKEKIAALMKTNDLLGAQDLILDKVEKKFGGTAKEVADSVVGDFKRMDIALGDLKEAFGELIATDFGPLVEGWTKAMRQISGKELNSNMVMSMFRAGDSSSIMSADLAQLKILKADLQKLLSEAKTPFGGESSSAASIKQAIAMVNSRLDAAAIAKNNFTEAPKPTAPPTAITIPKSAAPEMNAQALIQIEIEEALRKKRSQDAKENEENQRAAYEAQNGWLVELDALTEKGAKDQAARDAAEQESARQAYETQLEWDMELDQLEEDALQKKMQQQQEFTDLVKSSIGDLADAWMSFSSQQIQSQIDAKTAQIETIESGITEMERQYQAELAIKKAAGEDTTQFEVESLESIKKAKEEARRKEEKLKEEQTKLKRKAFEQEKLMSTASTVISGAQAAVKAYAELGPVFGPIGAAMVAGVTAAQVAVIQSQSVPALAEGGVLKATPGGRLVRVAEAGQDEAVIPLDRFNDFGLSGGGGDTYITYVQGIQYQDMDSLVEAITSKTAQRKREGRGS